MQDEENKHKRKIKEDEGKGNALCGGERRRVANAASERASEGHVEVICDMQSTKTM